jgi:hypothetical protein
MVTGTAVDCTVCHRQKKPLGRSAPLEMATSLCDFGCEGYCLNPLAGQLWPRETAEDFGYPVPAYGSDVEVAAPMTMIETLAKLRELNTAAIPYSDDDLPDWAFAMGYISEEEREKLRAHLAQFQRADKAEAEVVRLKHELRLSELAHERTSSQADELASIIERMGAHHKAEVERLRTAAEAVAAFDVTRLCEKPDHRPLRHPLCGECQLAARIEELRAAVKARGACQ